MFSPAYHRGHRGVAMGWLSDEKRGTIIGLSFAEWSHRAIAEELEIPKSTVGDVLRRHEETKKEAKGGAHVGRPPLGGWDGHARLVKALMKEQEQHPKASFKRVIESVCTPASGLPAPKRRTLNEWANNAGMYVMKVGNKGTLTQKLKEARLEWAESEINTVWENKVQLWGDGTMFGKPADPSQALEAKVFGKDLVKRYKGQACDPRLLNATAKGTKWKYKEHFFCAYGNDRAAVCEHYTWPMTAAKFLPILEKLGPAVVRVHQGSGRIASARNPWVYCQDGERALNASELGPLFRRFRMQRYEIPAGSGDLRCIEHWWEGVRERLYREDPGVKEKKEEWVERVRRTVLATSAVDLHRLTAGMHGRVLECIQKGGAKVHY